LETGFDGIDALRCFPLCREAHVERSEGNAETETNVVIKFV